MEITKEFLQARIGGLQEQLGNVLGEAARVRGAIDDCELLMRYLETPDSEEEAARIAEEVAQTAKKAAEERLLELQHAIYDCSDGQETLAALTKARVDSD